MSLHIATRTLRRRPLFALAFIATLAIGLGANITIFTVVDSLLLRSLPYPNAEQLVAVWATVQRDAERLDSVERRGLSALDVSDLATGVSGLRNVSAYTNGAFRLSGSQPERVVGTVADGSYFAALGTEPLLGRGLSDDPVDEQGLPGIVLSHALWQRRFEGNPQVLGDTVEVNGESTQIVGVMPVGFRGLVDSSQLWYPLSAIDSETLEARGSRWLEGVALLEDGATLEQVSEAIDILFASLASEFPNSNGGYSAALAPLESELVGDLRSPLLILWAAVSAVLLVALVNLTNLLIVHLRQRADELAISRALGATRTHLFRQFASEAVVLSVLGGVCGMALSTLSLRALLRWSPVDLPNLLTISLGARSILFAGALAVLLGLCIGAAATLRAPKTGLGGAASMLRATRRDPLRSGLMIAEVALATLLTITAGLLVLSFWRLNDVNSGMVKDGVGFLQLDIREGREPADLAAARRTLKEAVDQIPGIERVALATDLPLGGRYSATIASPEGRARNQDLPYSGATRIYRHRVSPEYFNTLGISLLQGRFFTEHDALPHDDESSGPEAPGVAIVSKDFADEAWPNESAIGKRFYLGPPVDEIEAAERRPWFDVVGVTANYRHRNLIPEPDEAEDPDVFFAMEQFNPSNFALMASSKLPLEPLLTQIDRVLRRADPSLIAFAPQTLRSLMTQETARPRFSSYLMLSFAGLALLLSAIGIYGVVAHTVEQRRKEIGIRMALGADRSRVTREIVGPAAAVVCIGIAAGAAVALGLGRYLESQMYAVSTTDARVFVMSVITLLIVGLSASALPARRASKVQPADTLRSS